MNVYVIQLVYAGFLCNQKPDWPFLWLGYIRRHKNDTGNVIEDQRSRSFLISFNSPSSPALPASKFPLTELPSLWNGWLGLELVLPWHGLFSIRPLPSIIMNDNDIKFGVKPGERMPEVMSGKTMPARQTNLLPYIVGVVLLIVLVFAGSHFLGFW
jgi:hypothetical protein